MNNLLLKILVTEDTYYFRFILPLFTDFLNPTEFKILTNEYLNDLKFSNFTANCLLFRLSSELNNDKTTSEKELLYSLVMSLLSKHTKKFNNNVHYSIGFVTAQAINLGVDATALSDLQFRLEQKHLEFLEEGFIDGLAKTYHRLIDNKKLFELFAAKYEHWGEESKKILTVSYTQFIPQLLQIKKVNPINSLALFLLKKCFTNESLLSFVDNYIEQSLQTKTFKNSKELHKNLDKTLFQTQLHLKNEQTNNAHMSELICMVTETFPELKNLDSNSTSYKKQFQEILEKNSKNVVELIHMITETYPELKTIDTNSIHGKKQFKQILEHTTEHIKSLELYQLENERVKRVRDSVRSIF